MFMEQLNNGSIVFLGGICMSTDMYIGQKRTRIKLGVRLYSRVLKTKMLGKMFSDRFFTKFVKFKCALFVYCFKC